MDKGGLYELNGKITVFEGLPFAIQQVLSMFLANITPSLLISSVAIYNGQPLTSVQIAVMIQNAMIIAGIGTIIQGFPLKNLGAGLPIVMGISFSFLSAGMMIAADDYGYLVGAVIVGGIIEGILGLAYKVWGKFISPLTSGCVVIAIGFSIIGSACNSFVSSSVYNTGALQNMFVAIITMLSAILFFLYGKGIVKQLYLMLALVVGYVASIPFGMLDFSKFNETVSTLGVLSLPHLMKFSPKFEIKYIVAITIIFLTSAAETVGDISALTQGTLNRNPSPKEIRGGLSCDGFISALSGGVFGITPITSFSGQIGTIIMTGIINRKCILLEGIILIAAGFCPPVGALLSTIPNCVLGGISVIAFGAILVSGIQMVAKEGFTERNILIVSISLTLGIGSTLCEEFYMGMPEMISSVFKNNPIAGVFIFSVFLSALFPKKNSQ